jgi:hypothetical protein
MENFEKKSSVERIVGYTSKQKEEIKEVLEQRFKKQNIEEIEETEEFEGLEEKEIKKTPEQIRIIKLVDDETNKLLTKYDLPEFKIPSENIHLLSEKDYEDLRGIKGARGAYFSSASQSVFISETDSGAMFLQLAFHEFLHFKSYQAFQKELEKKESPQLYREGLIAFSRDGEREYFRNLNEAVTQELFKRFYFQTAKDNPLFKKEIEKTEKIKTSFLMSEKDNEEREMLENIFIFRPVQRKKDGRFIEEIRESVPFCYPKEQKALNSLLDKLYQKNQDKFKDKEEVFDIFAKSMLNGNLMPVGKLVDRTLGKGSFRKIGELDSDVKKQKEFIDNL